jgi:hypothetical protein
MRAAKRLGATACAAALLTLGLGAGSALAAPGSGGSGFPGFARPLFVQTDGLTGNQIVVYDRGADGTLTPAGTYPTDGLGGKLEGSVVDHLASQGSLTLDRADGLLLAVNAGSNTISVFGAFGDHLFLRQTIPSGGVFPVSIAVHNGLVYVLNAEEGGSVAGFRAFGGRLVPIAGSVRPLGLNPTATPQFVNTPGQVAFTPTGSQLIVTTKANGSSVDVFGVSPSGRLSASPTVNSLPGAVPFAVSFDAAGHPVISEAGTDALATFELSPSGELTQLDALGTGQAATCWVVRSGQYFYASNAGSASLSDFQEGAGSQLTLFGQTTTDAGTVDATVPDGGRYLYVQTGGSGIVDEYSIAPSGALSAIGSVTVPGAVGGEGIVAP